MVAKGFESVGLPALARLVPAGFDAAAFCIVRVIGSVERLVVLGRIPWGKIKRHIISHSPERCLAISREYVGNIMYSLTTYPAAVLRICPNSLKNILAKLYLK